MIRVIQRRLIIPRGDTGVFTIPAMTQAEGAIGVFTIFDPITNTRIFQKQVEIEGENFNISFSHADTVNLQAGNYLWDIKFYKNPILADNKVIDGEEINSYYAAFQAPKCEIRETGDDFLMIEGQPAKIEDLNIILAATEAANAAKVAATEKAEEVAARLAEMVAAIPTKVSELENDSGYLQQETDPTVPAWAKAQTKPTYTAQEVGALPDNTFIPSKVSDLTDDSGHYVKPASGIPASDLEETYVKFNNYATTSTAGVVKVGGLGIKIRDGEIQLSPASDRQIKTNSGDNSPIVAAKGNQVAFYGLANAAGDTTQSQSSNSIGQYTDAAKAAIQQMLDVPSTADIPTNISDLANDAGYLTEHQDISGKANIADLATVATSGDYDDLLNKPTIPEVPVQDVQINGNSILENRIANIQTTSTIIQNSEMLITSGGVNQALNAILSVNSDQIKAGMNSKRPISPNKQHESTFYGLAKAAGDTTQSQSNNAVGTYTDDAKTAIQAMLDVPSNAAMITAIGNAIGNINSFDMAVVQELPTQDISTHTIYLVPKTGETNDVYDEYVYINSAWEMVGNTQIDLSNYVQKTDYASSSAAGIVRVAEQYGVSMVANSRITIAKATDDNIKAGINEYKAIVPNNQHKSVFYGLTKAAGVDMSSSENAVGTYTAEAKAAIRSMIGAAASADLTVQDVQVNGTSIVENGVANVPMADDNTYGVARVRTDGVYGVRIYNGQLATKYAASGDIKNGSNGYKPIVPLVQNESTFYGLAKAAGDTTQSQSSNAVGQYTDEAKAAIQTMLDVPSTSDIPDVSIYATKRDTVLETTLSRGRAEKTIVGSGSFAFGIGLVASGNFSHAEGSDTHSIGDYSHAEGNQNVAYGIVSHTEGIGGHAIGEIRLTSTDNDKQYTINECPVYLCIGACVYPRNVKTIIAKITNIDQNNNLITLNTTLGNLQNQLCNVIIGAAYEMAAHTEGALTIANGAAQHVQGTCNAIDINNTYADIVGNGPIGFSGVRSNAYALTWTGDGHYAGDVYVHSNTDSSGGERLAKESELGLKVVRLI